MMTGLGNMLGLNYMTVNVILFCYVEPIFTGLMLILAILSLCRVPVNKPGKWFFWIVVVTVISALILGGMYFLAQGITFLYGIHQQPFMEMGYYNEIDVQAERLFYKTMYWLKDLAAKVGTSYEAINLIIYVLFMPILCIASYVVLMVTKKRSVKQVTQNRV